MLSLVFGNIEGCFHFRLNIIKWFFHVLSIVELLSQSLPIVPHFLYVSKEMLHTIFFSLSSSSLPSPLSLVLAFICFLCRMNVADGNTQWALRDRFFFCVLNLSVFIYVIDSIFGLIWFPSLSASPFDYCLRDNCLIAQERKSTKSFFFFSNDILRSFFREGMKMSWDDNDYEIWRYREKNPREDHCRKLKNQFGDDCPFARIFFRTLSLLFIKN